VIVCGIDLGYANLGIALVELSPNAPSVALVDSVTTGVPRGTKPEAFMEVLGPVFYRFFGRADAVGAEALSTFVGRTRPGENPLEKADVFIKLGVVAGIASEAARVHGIPYRTITPQALKRAVTGTRRAARYRNGKTDKRPMVAAVRRLVPEFRGTNHEADAILAATAIYAPQAILAALAGANITVQ